MSHGAEPAAGDDILLLFSVVWSNRLMTAIPRSVTWLIEPDVFENLDQLVEAARAAGHEVEFSSRPENWSQTRQGAVIGYGSCDFVERISEIETLSPGVYLSEAFDCAAYYPVLGDLLLNSDYVLLPYGDLGRRLPEIFGDVPVFTRPLRWDKPFAGMVVHPTTREADLIRMGFYDLPVSSLVVVSPAKAIDQEWRLVVAGRSVVAACAYDPVHHRGLTEGTSSDVLQFAGQVVERWQPTDVFVMDVCRDKTGRLRLLELNPFNSSDLYSCDRNAIVAAVSTITDRLD